MRMLEFNCRICKKAGRLSCDDGCPQHWIDGLLPMVTCNRCFDLKTRRDKITGQIESAIITLFRSEGEKKAHRDKVIATVRTILEELTRQFAEVIAMYHNSTVIIWSEEFVNLLMEKPHKWQEILRQYRGYIREGLKRTQTEQTQSFATV